MIYIFWLSLFPPDFLKLRYSHYHVLIKNKETWSLEKELINGFSEGREEGYGEGGSKAVDWDSYLVLTDM